MRKWIIIIAGAIVFVLVIALIAAGPAIRSAVRNRTIQILQTHYESTVEFADFRVTLLPRAHVTISNLVLRHKGRTDIPPLMQIREVSMDASLWTFLRATPHVTLVKLDGLQIHTPPRPVAGEAAGNRPEENPGRKHSVLIEDMRAEDVTIVVLHPKSEKPPHEFSLRHLEFQNYTFVRSASFHTILTSTVPSGEIEISGKFGPWEPGSPGASPISAQYRIHDADLGSLKGIQGAASSTGNLSGSLEILKIDGEAESANLRLGATGRPVAVHADFSILADGPTGNTYLKNVTARFLNTSLTVKGEVVNNDAETKRPTMVLDAESREARVEDLVRLAAKTEEPLMTGSVWLKMRIKIPEAGPKQIAQLKMNGQFGIGNGRFTSPGIQGKIDTLSRKGQGQPKSTDISGVVSEMNGSFDLNEGTVTFSSLRFGVAGVALNLSGTYNTMNGNLDFHGTLLLQAKPSQTTTGAKSFFLKALDPFFKGKDSGTVLQIKITGTKDNPTFGIDRVSKSKKKDETPPKKSE